MDVSDFAGVHVYGVHGCMVAFARALDDSCVALLSIPLHPLIATGIHTLYTTGSDHYFHPPLLPVNLSSCSSHSHHHCNPHEKAAAAATTTQEHGNTEQR